MRNSWWGRTEIENEDQHSKKVKKKKKKWAADWADALHFPKPLSRSTKKKDEANKKNNWLNYLQTNYDSPAFIIGQLLVSFPATVAPVTGHNLAGFLYALTVQSQQQHQPVCWWIPPPSTSSSSSAQQLQNDLFCFDTCRVKVFSTHSPGNPRPPPHHHHHKKPFSTLSQSTTLRD